MALRSMSLLSVAIGCPFHSLPAVARFGCWRERFVISYRRPVVRSPSPRTHFTIYSTISASAFARSFGFAHVHYLIKILVEDSMPREVESFSLVNYSSGPISKSVAGTRKVKIVRPVVLRRQPQHDIPSLYLG